MEKLDLNSLKGGEVVGFSPSFSGGEICPKAVVVRTTKTLVVVQREDRPDIQNTFLKASGREKGAVKYSVHTNRLMTLAQLEAHNKDVLEKQELDSARNDLREMFDSKIKHLSVEQCNRVMEELKKVEK